jgi:hypothetical protein
MQQGQEVGALARELFPTGTFWTLSESFAIDLAEQLLAENDSTTIFEPRFEWDSLIARADILERTAHGWHLLEVKSSFSDTTSMSDLIDDLAYTCMASQGVGLEVHQASLMLLSRDYRHGAPAAELFEIVDCTEAALSRAKDFAAEHDTVTASVLGTTRPTPTLCSACRSCDYFVSDCLGHGLSHSVLEIPGLHHTKLRKLAADSIVDLGSLPSSLTLNNIQERAKDAALREELLVDGGLRDDLAGIEWPCSYLDFETVATVLPLYPGFGCHEQLLTQFSVHQRQAPSAPLRHIDYLADPFRDCQRELAELLIAALGDAGSVVVYSQFEKQRLKALSQLYPDLADSLDAIQTRLFDMLPVIKRNVYHPDFRGSFSIKAVLPALVPDLDYSQLDIAGGDSAITRFARIARGEITGAEAADSRQSLLEYCKMDTLAMVRLHEVLSTLA